MRAAVCPPALFCKEVQMKHVKCARCVKCGKEYEAVPTVEDCVCGGILDIIYDYDAIKPKLTKDVLKK